MTTLSPNRVALAIALTNQRLERRKVKAKQTIDLGLVTRVNKPTLITLIMTHSHALIPTNNNAANALKLQWT